MRHCFRLATAAVLLLVAHPPAQAQGTPAAETRQSPDAAKLFTKGSLWSGTNYQLRPTKITSKPNAIALIVTDRDGDNFKGELLLDGKRLRNVVGTVAGEKIEWAAAPGQAKPGHFNVGTINGKRIDIKYFKTKGDTTEDGSLTLELATPLADLLTTGSVWRGGEQQTPTRYVPIGLVITERTGDTFRADMIFNGKVHRKLEGKIEKDDISWWGVKGQPKPGSLHAGKIVGGSITGTFTINPDGSGEKLAFNFERVAQVAGNTPSRVDPNWNPWNFEGKFAANPNRQQQAAGKIVAAVLFHALVEEVWKSDPSFLNLVIFTSARNARDNAIDGALRDLAPNLSGRQILDIRLLITRTAEGRLDIRNLQERAAKDRLIADLREINPDLADAAVLADFLYIVHQATSRR
jgi:hypothetical protein